MQQQEQGPGLPEWLYVVIVVALAVYFIIGAIAWTLLALAGTPMPSGFATILATIAGGLVGVLTPGRTRR